VVVNVWQKNEQGESGEKKVEGKKKKRRKWRKGENENGVHQQQQQHHASCTWISFGPMLVVVVIFCTSGTPGSVSHSIV